MKPIVLRQHARDRMAQYRISTATVEEAVRAPEWACPDPDRPGIEQRYMRAPERAARRHPYIRVAVVEEEDHIRVVSVFPDRGARPPDGA